MQLLPKLDYPESEKPKLALLENLFIEWHQQFVKNNSSLTALGQEADEMVFDGFYPYYFSEHMKKRILFIGWETLEVAGTNYIEDLYKAYRSEEKRIGSRHLETNLFHSRMFYVAYGILHGMPEWLKINDANKLSVTFGTPKGWSFAFMNISKLSNESGKSKADINLINTAVRLSTESRNFIEEEIAILEPHIIIAMNLKDKLNSLGKRLDWAHVANDVYSGWLESHGHRSLLIDSFHFSAWRKEDISDYYEPICNAIRRSEAASDSSPKV